MANTQHADDDSITRPFVRRAAGLRPAVSRTESSAVRDALWDVNDVARYLKVSRSWVYHRAEAGLLPHLRVGGLLRFDPEAVRGFARK